MRDEITLIQSDVMKIEKVTKLITKVLDEDKKLLVKGRNTLHKEKLKTDPIQRRLTTICIMFKVC